VSHDNHKKEGDSQPAAPVSNPSFKRYAANGSIMDLKPHLEFAHEFVHRNRSLILELWEQADLETELKEDRSPVTKIDRKIELDFRVAVEQRFPKHSVLGEEFGLTGNEVEFTWVIDPIDGTQSLVNRVPTFGTFLALLHEGEPVLGIIDIPVLDRSVYGAVGLGVTDERGRTIEFQENIPFGPNDIVALGTSGSFARSGQQAVQAVLQQAFPTSRAYYDCFGHYLVATTGIAGLVEMNVPIWDVVATEALVKAAGGRVHVVRKNDDALSLRSSLCGRKEVVEEIERVLKTA
jgi:fructose-1,6-bisphosphatase/inositol monophosphatase family enzyme